MDYSNEEKIEKIRLEKEAAIKAGDFEKAAKLRDEEKRLSMASGNISGKPPKSAGGMVNGRPNPFTIILFPFIILSIIGLVLSLIVHISALLGYDLGLGQMVFILHIGIFIVWLPAVLVSLKTTTNFKRKDFWKAALRGCPIWMRNLTYTFFVYAIINFIIFIFKQSSNNTTNTLNITEIIGFSGHWMAFYSAALAILYSATKIKNYSSTRRCPNGHIVSELSKYCDECGIPIL